MDAARKKLLFEGTVIPAHPLALDERRKLDEYRQRRLTRYYLHCGVGGLAVGVHTTQFEIRNPEHRLLEPVLRMTAEEISSAHLDRPFIKVAGICGDTRQALEEATLAVKYGYDLGLVSLGGLRDRSENELITHLKNIAEVIPVFGFYLQPAVGGRVLGYAFWEQMAEIPGVYAIKTAPFNRYQTLDVVRAVCYSSRAGEIALYTGNDDNIISDLLTTYRFNINGKIIEKRFSGGLLGHWAVWTHCAVSLFRQIKDRANHPDEKMEEWLTVGAAITDMNAAIFDPQHNFSGSIAGIQEVLVRQGLLAGSWCLNKEEKLSSGQSQEIDRVLKLYPQFTDDNFVRDFLEKDLQGS